MFKSLKQTYLFNDHVLASDADSCCSNNKIRGMWSRREDPHPGPALIHRNTCALFSQQRWRSRCSITDVPDVPSQIAVSIALTSVWRDTKQRLRSSGCLDVPQSIFSCLWIPWPAGGAGPLSLHPNVYLYLESDQMLQRRYWKSRILVPKVGSSCWAGPAGGHQLDPHLHLKSETLSTEKSF